MRPNSSFQCTFPVLTDTTTYSVHPCALLCLRALRRFDLPLDSRLEYLTLAVGNAKSHPISAGGRHETAIAFLTDLEEKLDVAQVQLEIHNHLAPHVHDSPEVGERIALLGRGLLTMSEVRKRVVFCWEAVVVRCAYARESSCFSSMRWRLTCRR